MEPKNVGIKLARYIAEVLSDRTNDVRHTINIARVCKNKEEVDEAIKLLEKYKGI